ncbi:ABC transporter permease subunit [Listeria goaensis]|uniref:ABC transporter permease subunit n=1 Tax=Listeria goaensis TaxID=1649188 RepID=UPI000B596BA2|nr:ABC transporter permease subunit [Listeria goaensis]
MRLIQNEFQKLFLKKSSWSMQIILVVLIFLMTMLMFTISRTDGVEEKLQPQGITSYYNADGQPISEDDYWNAQNENKATGYTEKVLSPKDSVAALKVSKEAAPKEDQENIQKQIDYYQVYSDEGKIPMSSVSSMTGAEFFASLGTMNMIASILVAVIASMIVASEFSGGTIKLLLARPYSRSQILASKLAVVILYAVITSIVLFISAFLFSFILPSGAYLMPVSPDSGALNALQSALLLLGSNFIMMVVYASIAFLFSAVVRSQALAVGVSLGVLFSGSILSALLPIAIEKYDWLKWLIFNLLNLNSAVTGNPIAGDLAIWQIISGLAVYVLIFLGISFYFFRKRDVALS